eukprot:COSAG06_NODE_53107_length_302_cov_0.497537_2_plen_48_part_01
MPPMHGLEVVAGGEDVPLAPALHDALVLGLHLFPPWRPPLLFGNKSAN